MDWTVDHVRSLTAHSYSLRFSEPWEMLEIAKLACRLAEALSLRGSEGPDFEDACGEASSQLGNAHKVLAQFRSAELALDRAKAHLERGSLRPELFAWFWEVIGGLRRNQRRFTEATEALARSQEYRHQAGDIADLARCFICQAINYRYTPEPEKAVVCAQKAVRMLPGDADIKLIYSAIHTLVACLIDAGRAPEGAECLLEAEDLLDSQKDPLLVARRTWLRGELDVALGVPTAEFHFKKAAEAFDKYNMHYEQAQVLLQLSLLYSNANRDRDLIETIDKILPIFKALGIRREAMMARLLARVPRQRREVQRATLLRLYLLLRNSPAPPRKPKS
jgi:tetratricopeptide (TPR) repeat protein